MMQRSAVKFYLTEKQNVQAVTCHLYLQSLAGAHIKQMKFVSMIFNLTDHRTNHMSRKVYEGFGRIRKEDFITMEDSQPLLML
jgi:hypothetical protein